MSKDFAEAFPKGTKLVKIKAVFDDSDKEVELTYSPKYRRLYRLTDWFRMHNAQAGDIIVIQPIDPFKTYRFRYEKAKTIVREEEKVPKHNELRDIVAKIGKLERKNVVVEYPMENLKVDVVWKSIPSGDPKWVFEVQLGGNFYEALMKLKHAWDKWNSKPFLVTTDEFIEQARWWLEGPLHEMKDEARLVNWRDMAELWKYAKAATMIRKKIKL